MKTRLIAFLLFAGVLAVCLPMFAHHGSQAYDMNEFEIKGVTVTDYLWANPHCIIQFDAKDATGKVAHWAAELGSPSAIGLVGFTKVSVQKGDVITVYIHRSKTGNPVGRITRITLPDGSSLPIRGSADQENPGGGRGGNAAGGRGGRGAQPQY